MKLNTKRTILVGFAFFLICAFWQAYDNIVPLILTNKFGMDQGPSGIVMSLDNIFAVVMLPFFGAVSDKVKCRFGRRTPFIVCGTVAGAVFLSLLGVMPTLTGFLAILLASLVSMAVFRSPAVALMPDVTVKPLRSKANAIINLMGTAGGMIVLALGLKPIFNTGEAGKTDFRVFLLTVGGVMLAALVVFIFTVREPKWAKEAEDEAEALGITDDEEEQGKGKLSRPEFISLLLILASVALWYIGYNAVTSKYSVYATEFLHVDYSTTLLIAQAAAIVTYLPVGMLASKIGRKKSILLGVALLTGAFTAAAFLRSGVSPILMYALFALAGIGWATINVNSFPMVVELAKHGDTGKYTGYYYTASMAAQVVTPILSGYLVDAFGWEIFFPYAAVFAGLSFVTMLFVRHGDSRPEKQAAKLEAFAGED